jgi:hypothetical protein
MSAFFESLGAPLKNVRTSWGARRPKDGAIFLRCWSDESRVDADGQKWMQIAFPSGQGFGWRERQAHVKAIESGARCFVVVCEAEDVSASPRKVERFEQRTVAVGGDIEVQEGKTWIRIAGYKSIWDIWPAG